MCKLERVPVEYGLYIEILVSLALLGVLAVSLVWAAILDMREKLGRG